jgi:hypothetical protein
MKRGPGIDSAHVSWFTVGVLSGTDWYSMRTAGVSTAEVMSSYMAWIR